MKSTVKIYIQDYNKIEESNKIPLQADWDLERKLQREYQTDLEGEAAAEEAFRIFNKENLNEREKKILGDYNAPSLSVGDVVEVYPLNIDPVSNNETKEPKAYLCDSIGWQVKTIEGEVKGGEGPNKTSTNAPNTKNSKNPKISKETNPSNSPKVNFLGEECSLKVSTYGDSSNPTSALQLLCEDGSPMATVTINLEGLKLQKNHILVKNYSENSNMTQALEKARIARPIKTLQVGPFNSEVTLMEITSPWVLNEIEEAARRQGVTGRSTGKSATKSEIRTTPSSKRERLDKTPTL